MREGKREFSERRFVQAFYNFYFVIEGLYANGRTSSREVLKQFRKSRELHAATTITLDCFSKDPEQCSLMTELLGAAGHQFDVDGVWRFLFDIRGKLHHFSVRSATRSAAPFRSEEFEKPALLALILAGQSIAMRIVTINGGALKPSG